MNTLDILYYNNYYLDNITETISTIRSIIEKNEKDFYYLFENDINNINNETKQNFLKDVIVFNNNYNFMFFINEFLEYMKNNKNNQSNLIMMPLFLYKDIDNYEIINLNKYSKDYYIVNYLPFILIKYKKNNNSVNNNELIFNMLEDYYKKLNEIDKYIKKGNFYGVDYKMYINNYNIFFNKKSKDQ